MKFEIRSRWDSTLLFTCEAASLGLAVVAAAEFTSISHESRLKTND